MIYPQFDTVKFKRNWSFKIIMVIWPALVENNDIF